MQSPGFSLFLELQYLGGDRKWFPVQKGGQEFPWKSYFQFFVLCYMSGRVLQSGLQQIRTQNWSLALLIKHVSICKHLLWFSPSRIFSVQICNKISHISNEKWVYGACKPLRICTDCSLDSTPWWFRFLDQYSNYPKLKKYAKKWFCAK